MGDSCRYSKGLIAFERADPIFAAEKRVCKLDRKCGDEVVSFSRKISVSLDVELHVEIPRSASRCRLSPPWHADHFTVGNAGGDNDADLFFALRDSFAPARLARDLRDFTPAMAARASARRGECAEERIAGLTDVAFAVARRALDRLRAFACASPVAGLAYGCLCYQDTALRSEYCFFKRQFDVDRNIAAAASASASAAKKLAEHITEVKLELLAVRAKPLEALKIRKVEIAEAALRAAACEGATVGVVFCALLFVGQYRICLAYFLEFFLIAAFLVGVVLVCELPECRFYLLFACSFGDTEDLVVVFHGRPIVLLIFSQSKRLGKKSASYAMLEMRLLHSRHMNEVLLFLSGLFSTFFVYISWRIGEERLYTALVVFLILIGATGGKLVEFFGHETNTGNIFYAAVFLATYFLVERYGKTKGLRSVWIALIVISFFTVLSQITVLYEGVESTASFADALQIVFTDSLRVTVASLLAYAVSQTFNIYLYSYLKEKMNGGRLWLRANAANAAAQILDSVVFFTIAFWGVVPLESVWSIIVTGFFLKVIYMMLASPLLYLNTVEHEDGKGYAKITVR